MICKNSSIKRCPKLIVEHKQELEKEFVDADDDIEVIYFPPYSPEENSQEHVWKAKNNAQ